ncbi:ATP-binding cassette domain-containing protein [Psychrosphaera algicola]|uniref:ATP-binding cassette domain-containing protein n=1 Tax=Psychrosphaera algicola TaxID=3023714 RepID=A0ABT5FC62_9GAMM|nr:ATP-binding cassette domain-containing protein [Psychrosphaera sp. G1-22]MDC2888986.1 ATP-binding cassette domain-containing protein [Psychrosphaera sp. G1-22]
MSYEGLVQNPQQEIKKLLEYCELPFEEQCLQFYKTERAIRTPSAEQVRKPIHKDGLEQWKNYREYLTPLVGVVMQDSFLFNRTVRDNIALSTPTAPIERIVQVAKLAGADEFITRLPNGYETLIDEQGVNLSGGQKQRIAIARALLTNPKILIFDEATSALDYESERLIQENMKAICRDRTVIIVAHRLSAVQECHRIVVVKNGQIVEQGNSRQLMEHGGQFARMYGESLCSGQVKLATVL